MCVHAPACTHVQQVRQMFVLCVCILALVVARAPLPGPTVSSKLMNTEQIAMYSLFMRLHFSCGCRVHVQRTRAEMHGTCGGPTFFLNLPKCNARARRTNEVVPKRFCQQHVKMSTICQQHSVNDSVNSRPVCASMVQKLCYSM